MMTGQRGYQLSKAHYLRHCVAEAAASGGSEVDEKLTEASKAVSRLLRS